MSFIFLRSICWSSSHVNFKNVFWFSLVFSSFFSSFFFFHLRLFDGIRFQYSQVFLNFNFSEHSDFFLDLGVLFLPSFVIFRFLSLRLAHFSMPNSIPISLLYILIAWIKVSHSFFLANSLISSLVRQLVKERENSKFKPVKLCLKKLTLCHILPERRGWVNMVKLLNLRYLYFPHYR